MVMKNILRVLILGSILTMSACKKDKLDNVQINLVPSPLELTPSGIRLIDLYGLDHVKANGDSITNFTPPVAGEKFYYPATPYFPVDGRFGNHWWSVNNSDGKVGAIWDIPKQLFKKDGSVDFEFYNLTSAGTIDEFTAYSIKDQGKTMDYYISPFFTFNNGGTSYFVEVPREVSAPKEGHFKIRLLNLTAPVSTPPAAYGQLEDLTGPLTLAFADGSSVDVKTNAVPKGKASDYVELPYGSYQFKALTASKKIVPGASGNNDYRLIDPSTSAMPLTRYISTNVVYSSTQAFQPGGIYTVVITPLTFDYMRNEQGARYSLKQNAVKIITDIEEPINNRFFRVQGFNAVPGKTIQFFANGKEIDARQNYATVSSYKTLNSEAQVFELKDENGNVLDKINYEAKANENYTLWSFPDVQGKVKIGITVNNLSTIRTNGRPEADASYAYTKNSFPTDFRFINLCPDVPYLTLTQADGQPVGGTAKEDQAITNLQPGIFTKEAPYLRIKFDQMMAYRSAPGVIPGSWAQDIPTLTGQDLIANKALYTDGGKPLPPYEAGIYTIALIGRTGNQAAKDQKAKLVIVKHNK